MFNSGNKGNHRCNGLTLPSSGERLGKSRVVGHSYYNRLISNLTTKENYSKNDRFGEVLNNSKTAGSYQNSKHISNHVKTEVKVEPDDNYEHKFTAHSIIGLNNVKEEKPQKSPWFKKANVRATHHEALQRIELVQDVYNHYQKNWFSSSLEKFNLEDRSREERIEITRHEFRRHLYQIMRSNLGQSNKLPDLNQKYIKSLSHNIRKPYQSGYDRLVAPKMCENDNCYQPALPCTKHCTLHIMCNTDQVLFDYCTAKFSDNTQCSMPVFDITHELPLCPEHARKRDNYKLYQEAKPKKLRKKVKPSAMIRPQKRNKKKKRTMKHIEVSTQSAIIDTPVIVEVDDTVETESPELVEDMHIVNQVLGLNETDGLEQELGAQASHILEETDISTVLSTIQVDEFSDFFTVNRNGEYEPSREEAEELEKALAAVDNDVKSLEKLSQSQGLLDSLLDEHALAEHLVQIPDVFHNGYTTCGDSMVAQTSSFLLPVEPHSHS